MKSMDTYKKKYDEAMLRADEAVQKGCLDKDMFDIIFPPEESEDERIRKEIIEFIKWSVDRHFMREDFHQAKRPSEWIVYLEKQKYDRMRPIYDARESFESALEKAWNDYHNGYENVDKLEDDYVECAHAKGFREGYLFGIEKQKEQKPAEPSDEELERHQKELYDFKVFAAKQAKEHHISFVHDFEWNNFCAELLSYFHEQKPELVQQPPITYTYNSNASRDERLKAALLALLNSDLLKVKEGGYFTKQDLIDWVDKQKPAEWSDEDEDKLYQVIETLLADKEVARQENPQHYDVLCKAYDELIAWLKSLRPSWKPSEKQEEPE